MFAALRIPGAPACNPLSPTEPAALTWPRRQHLASTEQGVPEQSSRSARSESPPRAPSNCRRPIPNDYSPRADAGIADEGAVRHFHACRETAARHLDMGAQNTVVADPAAIPDEAEGSEQVSLPGVQIGQDRKGANLVVLAQLNIGQHAALPTRTNFFQVTDRGDDDTVPKSDFTLECHRRLSRGIRQCETTSAQGKSGKARRRSSDGAICLHARRTLRSTARTGQSVASIAAAERKVATIGLSTPCAISSSAARGSGHVDIASAIFSTCHVDCDSRAAR